MADIAGLSFEETLTIYTAEPWPLDHVLTRDLLVNLHNDVQNRHYRVAQTSLIALIRSNLDAVLDETTLVALDEIIRLALTSENSFLRKLGLLVGARIDGLPKQSP